MTPGSWQLVTPQRLRTIVLAGIGLAARFSFERKDARSLRQCGRPSCRSGSQRHRQLANEAFPNQGLLVGRIHGSALPARCRQWQHASVFGEDAYVGP